MKILHIANDYSWTKVHQNLYVELDQLNCSQVIFNPLRNFDHKGRNGVDFKTSESVIIYSAILRKYYKFFFRLKIRKLYKDLKKKVDLETINIVHATTLFSDGALALKIYNEHKIPYIVAVRDTDINTFLKYRPDLYLLCLSILENSKKIIFISEANKFAFYNHHLIKYHNSKYKNKIVVIYNGIDDYWINNRVNKKMDKIIGNKILYVGGFSKRKNVTGLISAISKIRKEIPDLELSLVGGGGSNESEILRLICNKDWIRFYGAIQDKNELNKIYRKHKLFAMVSFSETFGLVYLEALSQGLPILFAKGQGVDGVFKSKVGESVDPFSEEDIELGLKKIVDNYSSYEINKVDFSIFKWSFIAMRYLKIYNDILK